MRKKCFTCKVEKPLSEFSKEHRNKDGYKGQCKDCIAKYQDKWRNSNKALKKEYGKRWYYKSKHSISYNEFLYKCKSQNNRCAICNVELNLNEVGNTKAVQDHDHSTGKLRDILCHSCNLGLGKFMDNASIVEAAFNYLRRHNEQI